MRIVDHDELTSAMETQVNLLNVTAFGGVMDFKKLREARRLGYPATDYFGVYAVEDGEVLSEVSVLRIPFTTVEGEIETVSGIQGVATRRDRSGRGLARKLLREVHRREKAAGIRFVLLWTGRAMIAHSLYASMGYADVYAPKIALRYCGESRSPPDEYGLRRARETDAETIERIHTEATRGRIGFTPRPRGLVGGLFKLGFVQPDSIRVILRDGKAVGYAEFLKGSRLVRSAEVVHSGDVKLDDVLGLLESQASDRWLVLRNTFVQDALSRLKSRGYAISEHSYYGLLASHLVEGRKSQLKTLGTSNPLFCCQYLDYF